MGDARFGRLDHARPPVAASHLALGEPGFFQGVDGLGDHVGAQPEHAGKFGLGDGRARRGQFDEHAVLGDVQLACRFQTPLEGVVGHFERDEIG